MQAASSPGEPLKHLARGRHIPGTMNKTEAAFADRLRLLQYGGEVLWWCFEEITLKLGPDCRYTPDYAAMAKDGILDLYEVKAHKFNAEESRAKFKVAAGKFPFRFWWAEQQKDKSWLITTPFAEDR